MSDRRPSKIVFLGDAGVGKTSILTRHSKGIVEETQPTTSPGCFNFPYSGDGESVLINYWDTAGQENFQGMTTLYVRNAIGAVLVFDLTSMKSFTNLQKWFRLCTDTVPPPELFFVVGNKRDLVADREVKRDIAEEWAIKRNASYVEVSAVSGEGLDDLFPFIGNHVLRAVSRPNQGVTVPISANDASGKGGCCK